MTDTPGATRLVTFLGTGKYEPVVYRDLDTGRQASETPWIALALADLFRPSEIVVLATPTAEAKHGVALLADLRRAGFEAELRRIDEGGAPEHLWQQFEVIKAALRAPSGEAVVLDITHGFRSQPFFAAAVVAFVRAVDPEVAALRVVYGGFEARDADGVAPLWDLTPFVDVLDYAREIMLFLKTGRVAGVADRTEALGRQLAKDWSQALAEVRGSRPTLDSLARALDAFGRDLETVRTGALLLGDGRRPGSAAQLLREIGRTREALAEQLPPLADVLDRIDAMAAPLAECRDRLNTAEGHAALCALARLYLAMGRYSEAATTVREGLVTLYADDAAARPGLSGYDRELREAAERAFQLLDRDLGRRVAQPRNDIDHAGYRPRPLPALALVERIEALVAGLAVAERRAPQGCAPVFVNLSNHPSAEWEAAQRTAALALAPRIVDVPFPEVDPDAEAGRLDALVQAALAAVPEAATHAMVQGEFTVAFALVRGLQRRGIRCLAATTRREVEDRADGGHFRRFGFVAFRPYLDG